MSTRNTQKKKMGRVNVTRRNNNRAGMGTYGMFREERVSYYKAIINEMGLYDILTGGKKTSENSQKFISQLTGIALRKGEKTPKAIRHLQRLLEQYPKCMWVEEVSFGVFCLATDRPQLIEALKKEGNSLRIRSLERAMKEWLKVTQSTHGTRTIKKWMLKSH